MEPASVDALLSAHPIRGYTKQSFDEFVTSAEHERDRLRAELAQIEERRASAERAAAELRGERGSHTEMVEEARRLVAELKRENQRTISAVLAAADVEVSALVAAARARRALPHPGSDDSDGQAAPLRTTPTLVDLGAL